MDELWNIMKKKIWSFSTFRGGRGPDQGRENSLLFFFSNEPFPYNHSKASRASPLIQLEHSNALIIFSVLKQVFF